MRNAEDVRELNNILSVAMIWKQLNILTNERFGGP